MKFKTLSLITILLLLICSCEVGIDDSSVVTNNSSLELSVRSEINQFVLKTLNEAKSVDMTVSVMTYFHDYQVEIRFYYVSNEDEKFEDYEMAMMVFMIIYANNQERQISVSESFFKNSCLYITLLNSSNGEYDRYAVNISNEDKDIVKNYALIGLFKEETIYDKTFSIINEDFLSSGKYYKDQFYNINFNTTVNEGNITKVKVDKNFSELYIYTKEFDEDNNKIEQEIKILPSFTEKYEISFPNYLSLYNPLTFDELKLLLNY